MTGDAANGAPRAWQPVRMATFPGAPAVPGAPQPLGRRVDGTLRKTTDGGAPVPQPSWTVGGAGAAPRRTAPTITLNLLRPFRRPFRRLIDPRRPYIRQATMHAHPPPREHRARAGGSLGGSADVNLSALPDVNGRHYCCVADDALVPSHPAAHDPHGSDGVDETVRAIVSVGGTVADAAAAMSRRRAAEARAEDDVFADECVVSLHCPLSSRADDRARARGGVRTRGVLRSAHVRSVRGARDARVAEDAVRGSPRVSGVPPDAHREETAGSLRFCKHWRCPICRTPTTIGALRFDPFTDDIIKNNPGLRRVKVTRSKGTYAPMSADEDARGDDDSERIDDARAVRPASNGKGKADGDGDDACDGDATRGASGPEVIELSDASDEEMDPRAADSAAAADDGTRRIFVARSSFWRTRRWRRFPGSCEGPDQACSACTRRRGESGERSDGSPGEDASRRVRDDEEAGSQG